MQPVAGSLPGIGRPITLHRTRSIALVGNPNAGKTTLFNALTGLRAKTANFPGTTVERRSGRCIIGSEPASLIDLPGLYSLSADAPDAALTRGVLDGSQSGLLTPDAVLVVLDATNLERNLVLATEVLEQDRPTVVALNMMDVVEREGISIDVDRLRGELGCPVVPIAARTGRGVDDLKAALAEVLAPQTARQASSQSPACTSCRGCGVSQRYLWSEGLAAQVRSGGIPRSKQTDKIDAFLTHPVLGLLAFALVMAGLFALLFWAAEIPMNLIDGLFVSLGAAVASVVPAGDFQSLLVDGVIGGVGGVLVFLPLICILFFVLALLEDTGYLARAALVTDKVMRSMGLPGKAFVPLISAHACAVPAIMSTRVIENARDRLVTILIAPLMTCSARIPVYAMVAALIFPSSSLRASLVFVGAYAVGTFAALASAVFFGRTITPGQAEPLVLELPPYRIPSLRTAFLHTFDRASVFVSQAGTIILAVSLTLWFLSNYPKSDPPAQVADLMSQAEDAEQSGDLSGAIAMSSEAERVQAQSRLQNSFAGHIGHAIEPLIAPLGFDWQIGIGILSSFVAREVVVSTLAIVYGVGDAGAENPNSLYDTLRRATRSDGSPVFGIATSMSLLVFYILAAQCFSTTAIVRRETNGWKWPLFQIGYMTSLAYVAALATFQTLRAFGY